MGMTDRDFQNLENNVRALQKRMDGLEQSLNRSTNNAALAKRVDLAHTLIHKLDDCLVNVGGVTSKLDAKIAALQRGSTNSYTKDQINALITAGDGINEGLMTSLERDLTAQINNLRKQMDNLAKQATH